MKKKPIKVTNTFDMSRGLSLWFSVEPNIGTCLFILCSAFCITVKYLNFCTTTHWTT